MLPSPRTRPTQNSSLFVQLWSICSPQCISPIRDVCIDRWPTVSTQFTHSVKYWSSKWRTKSADVCFWSHDSIISDSLRLAELYWQRYILNCMYVQYIFVTSHLSVKIPILDIVAGEACERSCVSNIKLMLFPNWIRHPDGKVSSLKTNPVLSIYS